MSSEDVLVTATPKICSKTSFNLGKCWMSKIDGSRTPPILVFNAQSPKISGWSSRQMCLASVLRPQVPRCSPGNIHLLVSNTPRKKYVKPRERERERTPTRSLSFLFGENCKDSWERDLCKIASLGGLHLLISIFTGFSREECITMSLQSHPKSSHSSHTSPVTEMPKAEKRCQPPRVRPVWASRRCSLSHLDGQMDPPARAPQARSRYHFSRSDRCFGPFVA